MCVAAVAADREPEPRLPATAARVLARGRAGREGAPVLQVRRVGARGGRRGRVPAAARAARRARAEPGGAGLAAVRDQLSARLPRVRRLAQPVHRPCHSDRYALRILHKLLHTRLSCCVPRNNIY